MTNDTPADPQPAAGAASSTAASEPPVPPSALDRFAAAMERLAGEIAHLRADLAEPAGEAVRDRAGRRSDHVEETARLPAALAQFTPAEEDAIRVFVQRRHTQAAFAQDDGAKLNGQPLAYAVVTLTRMQMVDDPWCLQPDPETLGRKRRRVVLKSLASGKEGRSFADVHAALDALGNGGFRGKIRSV